MQISLNKKHVVYVVGTIILGALGSGLWDLAIKPSLIFATEFFVDVLLGAFQGIQNSIYEDVASLDREITGRMMLAFGMGGLMGIASALISRIFRGNDEKKKPSPPSKFNAALFALFLFVFSIFTVAQTSYIISKQDDYLQLSRIISPYLTSEERLALDSRFSLISSSADYTKLMDEMRRVAVKNEILLPDHFE